MTIEELKIQYQLDLELQDNMIDSQALALPKLIAKYQFYYSDLLNELNNIQDSKSALYHNLFTDYKLGNSELSNLVLNSSELKSMLTSSKTYRDKLKQEVKLENELKLVEEMLSNIKSMSFSINNYLTYKKIIMGIV